MKPSFSNSTLSDGNAIENIFIRSSRYGFNEKEKDDEIFNTTGTSYDFGASEFDPRLGKFWSVDRMERTRPEMSPYHFCSDNPILRVDPTGNSDSPIYDVEGNLQGTDDQGLKGDAIVLNKSDFKQGMSHDEAQKKDLGTVSLNDQKAQDKFKESYSSLPQRPDYDGKLTLNEANNWWANGGGQPLFVDASQINLSPVTKSDFGKVGDSKFINFASPGYANMETGLVYGTIKLTLMNAEGVIKLGGANNFLDTYDFDYQKGRTGRNIATFLGKLKAGEGTPFNIYDYGTGKVK